MLFSGLERSDTQPPSVAGEAHWPPSRLPQAHSRTLQSRKYRAVWSEATRNHTLAGEARWPPSRLPRAPERTLPGDAFWRFGAKRQKGWRRGPESNRRIEVLQTSA